jgi:GNAT superfamily N-acetyltransferase
LGTDLHRLARSLPDIPRWVETRGLLLCGRCTVVTSPGGFLVRAVDGPLVCSVGRPDPEAVWEAVVEPTPDLRVLTPPEESEHLARALAGWKESPATIHRLAPEARPALDPKADVRLLQDTSLLELLPESLQEEISWALPRATVAVAFADGLPAAVCYSCWETETLWDVSIETMAELRRKGLAQTCTAFLIQHMRERGKEPVWGAEDVNLPSLRLAAKMGFVPVDRLVLFSPPAQRAAT